jgi:3-deoxy-D-manno-octulosonic-acid transferase
MRGLYNLLLVLLSPLWLLYTLVRIVGGSWRERWWERFGFVPIPPAPSPNADYGCIACPWGRRSLRYPC